MVIIFFVSCNGSKDYMVNIHTPMGDMKVLLYEETPLHKENFLRLAKTGNYDSTEWHRIIEGFMIQGGNIYEKIGKAETEEDRIPAEIIDGFYHTKGSLAAARQGDQVNPEKKSSGSQFYIVHGKVFNEPEMTIDQYQLNQGLNQMLSMDKYADVRKRFVDLQQSGGTPQDINNLAMEYVDACEAEFGIKLRKDIDPERLKLYTTVGGAPHLDSEYTVFGRVVEGIEVIDKIAAVRTGRMDRPVEKLFMTMDVEEVPKKEITEKYGYSYPEE